MSFYALRVPFEKIYYTFAEERDTLLGKTGGKALCSFGKMVGTVGV